jgi:hypothetical protein
MRREEEQRQQEAIRKTRFKHVFELEFPALGELLPGTRLVSCVWHAASRALRSQVVLQCSH